VRIKSWKCCVGVAAFARADTSVKSVQPLPALSGRVPHQGKTELASRARGWPSRRRAHVPERGTGCHGRAARRGRGSARRPGFGIATGAGMQAPRRPTVPRQPQPASTAARLPGVIELRGHDQGETRNRGAILKLCVDDSRPTALLSRGVRPTGAAPLPTFSAGRHNRHGSAVSVTAVLSARLARAIIRKGI
jgi:hypothetical protein